MGATSIEYRFRFFLHAVIITLGFWAPWCEPLHWTRMTTWLVLASSLSRAASLSDLFSRSERNSSSCMSLSWSGFLACGSSTKRSTAAGALTPEARS